MERTSSHSLEGGEDDEGKEEGDEGRGIADDVDPPDAGIHLQV